MMVLERRSVAAIVGVGLVLGLVSTVIAPAQTSAKAKSHRSKTAPAAAAPSDVVQPDHGAPPDQAVKPDEAAPLQLTPNYDPPAPPPPPPDPVPPAPAQTPQPQTTAAPASATAAAVEPQAAPPKPVALPAEAAKTEPPAPTRPMTPEEQQLEKDSTLLLKLVQELKAEIEKAGTNTLSLSALRKADEIQKLSKSLKERAKGQSAVVQTKTQ